MNNMEIPPAGENGAEKVEKAKVLEMLRTNGFDHPETRELVIKWTEQQEALVVTSRDTIALNIERTDLYLATGDIKGAKECLEDALTQADQENERELQDQIVEKIKNLSTIDTSKDGADDEQEKIKIFEDTSRKIVEDLGYKVLENDGKWLTLEKDGYRIQIKHFIKPSESGYNKGRISAIGIAKDDMEDIWDRDGNKKFKSRDEGANKIFKELVDVLN